MEKIQALNADGKVCEFNGTEWVNLNDTREENTSENQPKRYKPKLSRTRRFCISSYIDADSLESFVSSLPWVQHWAMCTHNRDINTDGTLKDVHTHILLYTYEAKTSSAIKKKFDNFSKELYRGTDTEPQNTLVMICHDMSAQWRYLIHKDDLDKAQYDPCERKCDNFSYWHKLEHTNGMNDSDNNIALAIVNDLLDGTSTMDMLSRYGREYAINSSKYKQVARDHMREKDKMCCHDGLDLVTLCLESKYPKDKIYLWFEMLYYVRSECLFEYGQKVELISDGECIKTADLQTIIEL